MNDAEHDARTDPSKDDPFVLRALLILHVVVVLALGIPVWILLTGLDRLAAIADPASYDPTGLNVVLAVLLGPTFLLNPLAALHLKRRPRRAKSYLALAGVAVGRRSSPRSCSP